MNKQINSFKSKYRIIYKKQDGKYYCQKSYKYNTWFGFGKEAINYETLKRWCEGSNYPPYSDGSYIDKSYSTLEDAKIGLDNWIKFNKKNNIEIVYEK